MFMHGNEQSEGDRWVGDSYRAEEVEKVSVM
jgi:hypothetical protein